MIRRILIAFVALFAANASWAAERPNVLVVLTDDLRWDALGVVQREQGANALYPWFKTPNIDRLAAEGVRFSNAFCTTALCSPSRASLLSGRYAHRHGVLDNFTDFPTNLPSYPKALRAAGYETGYIGKWHMGEDDDTHRTGFDFWMSHRGQGNYFDTEFRVDGQRKLIKGYYTTVVTDAAVDWIGKKRDKPWLLVLGHKAPHGGPIVPEPRYEKAFDDQPVRKPRNAGAYTTASGKPAWLEVSYPTWHGLGGPLYGQKEYDRFVRAYLGTVASVDDSVGRVYAALKESGQLDRTLIVFTTDNGFAVGEHGRVDKRTAYEESLRIPLLVRYPPLATPGRVVTDMTLTLDLAPTLADVCGAAPLPDIDGRSFKPLLSGPAPADWRKAFFYQYNYETQFPYTPNVRAIRTTDAKYIHYPHGDGSPDRYAAELYDLSADPLEEKNLVTDPAHVTRLPDMQDRLKRLMKAHGADPDKMPLDEGIRNVLPKY